MSMLSAVLPATNVEDRFGDDKNEEKPTSDANTMVEKHDDDSKTGLEHINEPERELAPSEYPEGLQFLFILLALILSIFMIALDMVCMSCSDPLVSDPNCVCRLSSQRLSQRLRTSLAAFPRSGGTVRPSS